MKDLANKVKNMTVLLVEDDDEIRKRLANTLSFYFKDIYEANCGYDGYDVFLEKKPSLCLLDIQMKDGNGIELVKKIRKINFNAPIIILSAYSKEEYLLELINKNINHFILKPATKDSLLKAISNALFQENNKSLKLFDNLYLDIENNELLYKNEFIVLRSKEKHFLQLLWENKNKIVNYEMIQEYIWGEKFMTQNALKVFIKELRKKLPLNIIENVISEGYRLKSDNT